MAFRVVFGLGLAFMLGLGPTPAHAKIGQTRVGSPPPALQPRPTRTGHEIGLGTHLHYGQFWAVAFLPRGRYRYQFDKTRAQGSLSGLWLEAAIGPAIYGDPDGNAAFNLGFEFDPFSNLALTFSPVLRNDLMFDVDWALFSQTYGASVRLYIDGNWVVFVNPFAFGWYLHNYGGFAFAFQGGAGFGYKF
ncbi:MAG: hypothetical protein AAGF11_31095 [Myxococcota bacterium]